MDNVSTHMSQKVIDSIRVEDAEILFTSPFSRDLNPIENSFSWVKRHLKRNGGEKKVNWGGIHLEALASINRRCVSIILGIMVSLDHLI